jgi:formylglycine-generating enzyme required for sulfatase activity
MKSCDVVSGLNLLVAMILVGCAATASETVVPTQSPSVHVESTVTVSPPKNIEMPTLVAVAGPDMEVGSTYFYVDGTTLVAVPAGEFLMGKDNAEHTVILNDYWIYSTKVTNQQYALCEALGKCTSPNLEDNLNYKDYSRANDPVVGITYDQAATYCSFVHGRLPTEAEWEKSARNPGGSLYPWGDTAPSCDLVNFNNCVGGTTSVVDYQTGASFYGALDLVGNTFEWVADWYAADYYVSSPKENPPGPSGGTTRSVRSSSFASNTEQISVTNRTAEDPQNHRPDLAFRCVIDDPAYFAPFCELPRVYEPDGNTTLQSPEVCPTLDITQAPYCAGKLPLTNVKFEGPADATIDSSNCTPSDDPGLFTCQAPGTIVSITANCQVDLTGNSLCPDGFLQQDNQCIANGNAGQCLDGSYDSAQRCCVVTKSSDLVSTATVCPVGTFYSKKENACLANPVKELVTVTLDVLFDACTMVTNGGGGDDGGDGGACAEQNCGPLNPWSLALCCCTVYGDLNTCEP